VIGQNIAFIPLSVIQLSPQQNTPCTARKSETNQPKTRVEVADFGILSLTNSSHSLSLQTHPPNMPQQSPAMDQDAASPLRNHQGEGEHKTAPHQIQLLAGFAECPAGLANQKAAAEAELVARIKDFEQRVRAVEDDTRRLCQTVKVSLDAIDAKLANVSHQVTTVLTQEDSITKAIDTSASEASVAAEFEGFKASTLEAIVSSNGTQADTRRALNEQGDGLGSTLKSIRAGEEPLRIVKDASQVPATAAGVKREWDDMRSKTEKGWPPRS
jgi:hypothetical protein